MPHTGSRAPPPAGAAPTRGKAGNAAGGTGDPGTLRDTGNAGGCEAPGEPGRPGKGTARKVIPHVGQVPGVREVTAGCIGHANPPRVVGRSAMNGLLADPVTDATLDKPTANRLGGVAAPGGTALLHGPDRCRVVMTLPIGGMLRRRVLRLQS